MWARPKPPRPRPRRPLRPIVRLTGSVALLAVQMRDVTEQTSDLLDLTCPEACEVAPSRDQTPG